MPSRMSMTARRPTASAVAELAGEQAARQAVGDRPEAALDRAREPVVLPGSGGAELPDDLRVLVEADLEAGRGDDPAGQPVGPLAGQVEGDRRDVVRRHPQVLL